MSSKFSHIARALLLSTLLCLTIAPIQPAWAEEGTALGQSADAPAVITEVVPKPKQESVDGITADSDDLLDAYLEQRLNEQLPNRRKLRATKGVGGKLTGNDAVAYGVIKEAVQQIAAGERPSTTVEVPIELVCDKTTFSAEDLGVSAIMIGGVLNPEVDEALNSKVAIDFPCIVQALLSDCPYDLYWFDKKTGYAYAPFSYSYNSSRVTITTNPFIQFAVAGAYAGDGEYTVSTPVGQNVTNAIADANAIVSANANKSSFKRLQAYKQAICDRVVYDHDSADNDDTPYGDPWQLISVFDGDSNTNVVCEGYSKAFKYLCDLSGFADIECKLVSGTMDGGTGAGNHMWDVLAMPDGKNYLVDVTNCDEGTAGYPDELFLKGFSNEGTTTYDDGTVGLLYAYETSGGQIQYEYGWDTLKAYDLSELVMSATDYDTSSMVEPTSISLAEVHASDVTYDGTPQEPVPTVTLDGVTLASGTDYNVVGYADNIDAGTATVTVGGIGSYEGTAMGTFTIMPKQVTPIVALSATSFTYDGTEHLPAIASVTADGEVLDASAYTVTEPEGCTDAGTYTFEVTLNEGGNYVGNGTASFVIVKANQTIDVAAKTLVVGETVGLGVTVIGGGALNYSSSDESVVTVDESGTLTGVGGGTATITITAAATNNYEAAIADVEISVVAQSGPLSLKERMFRLLRVPTSTTNWQRSLSPSSGLARTLSQRESTTR